MTDIINPSPSPMQRQDAFNPPPDQVKGDPSDPFFSPKLMQGQSTTADGKPADAPRHSKDDTIALHHDLIRQLALEVRGASPSAAESISAKIIASLDAIRDPEAWQKRQDEAKKVEDDREAERKAIREKLRPTAESKVVEKAT